MGEGGASTVPARRFSSSRSRWLSEPPISNFDIPRTTSDAAIDKTQHLFLNYPDNSINTDKMGGVTVKDVEVCDRAAREQQPTA